MIMMMMLMMMLIMIDTPVLKNYMMLMMMNDTLVLNNYMMIMMMNDTSVLNNYMMIMMIIDTPVLNNCIQCQLCILREPVCSTAQKALYIMPIMNSTWTRMQYCTKGIIYNANYDTWYCIRVHVDLTRKGIVYNANYEFCVNPHAVLHKWHCLQCHY